MQHFFRYAFPVVAVEQSCSYFSFDGEVENHDRVTTVHRCVFSQEGAVTGRDDTEVYSFPYLRIARSYRF